MIPHKKENYNISICIQKRYCHIAWSGNLQDR